MNSVYMENETRIGNEKANLFSIRKAPPKEVGSRSAN